MKKALSAFLAIICVVASFCVAPTLYAVSNEEAVYQFLKTEMRLNDAACCGVMANIYGESRFDPSAYCIDVDGLPSFGLCQWHAGRLDQLKDYCKENGLDYNTVSGQMSFLKYELNNTERYAYSMILGLDRKSVV